MILKSYEINKINHNINHLILFYGKNEGLKNEATNLLKKEKDNILKYEEKEILDKENNFFENILSKSLFEKEKLIVIKRATDKILKIIEILHLKNIDDTTIILNSDNLEKKSKITKDTNIIALELSISNKIGLNVEIQNNKRNKGKISFEYKDLDQLNKIIDIIKSNY